MHGADWLTTLADVAGYTLDDTLPLDGVNQWPAIVAAASGTAPPLPPRNFIVLGNSTNACSWSADDDRYHGSKFP